MDDSSHMESRNDHDGAASADGTEQFKEGNIADTGKNDKSYLQQYARIIRHIDRKITRVFLVPLVSVSAKNPWICIVLIIIVSFLLPALGVLTGSLNVVTDNTILWAPYNSAASENRGWVDNESGFGKTVRFSQFILYTVDDDDLLNENGIRRVFDVIQTLQQSKSYRQVCIDIPKENPEFFDSDEVKDDYCNVLGVTRFWDDSNIDSFDAFIDDAVSAGENVTEEIVKVISGERFSDGVPVSRARMYSPDVTFEEAPLLQSISAYKAEMYIPNVLGNGEYNDYEMALTKVVTELNQRWQKEQPVDGVRYRVSMTAVTSITTEVAKVIGSEMPLAFITFFIMGIFACLVFSRFGKDKNGNRFVNSSGSLGAGAMITIMLSIMSGYGVCFLARLPFTSLTQTLPFILYGIGLDDAFIIWGAFDHIEDKSLPILDQLVTVIDDIGMTILTTTATNVVAFSIGALSDLPAIRSMCIYAAITIFIDFMYQITFFIALLTLNHRRIQANRYDVLFFKAPVPLSDDDEHPPKIASPSTHSMRSSKGANGAEGKNADAVEECSSPPVSDRLESEPMEMVSNTSLPLESSESWTDGLISRYADFILHPVVKIFVLIGFGALLLAGGMSALGVEKDFDYSTLTPRGSYVDEYFIVEEAYRPTASGGLCSFYFRDMNVSDPQMQNHMLRFVDDMVENHSLVSGPPTAFWLRDLLRYQNATSALLPNRTFNEALDDFLSVDKFGEFYDGNIIRNAAGDVEVSRVDFLYDVPMNAPEYQETAYTEQLQITARQSLNKQAGRDAMFSYSIWYTIWAHYESIERVVIQTLAAGLIAVMVVTSIALPHPAGPPLAVLITAMVDINVIGVIPWAGFALNSLSLVFIVMAVGFVVDFNVHMIHGYLSAPHTNPGGEVASREDRVRHAINRVGGSVMLGGLSSALGFCALAFASSDLFWMFFVMLISLVLLGMGYGLAFLPVLLSLVGPLSAVGG